MKDTTKNSLLTAIRLTIGVLDALLLCRLLHEHQKHITDLEDKVDEMKNDMLAIQSGTPDSPCAAKHPFPYALDVQDPVEKNADLLHRLLEWCKSIPKETIANTVQVFFLDMEHGGEPVIVTNISRNGTALDIRTEIKAGPETGVGKRSAGIPDDRLEKEASEIAGLARHIYTTYMEKPAEKHGTDENGCAKPFPGHVSIGKNSDETRDGIIDAIRKLFDYALSNAYPHDGTEEIRILDKKDSTLAIIYAEITVAKGYCHACNTLDAYVMDGTRSNKTLACKGINMQNMTSGIVATTEKARYFCESRLRQEHGSEYNILDGTFTIIDVTKDAIGNAERLSKALEWVLGLKGKAAESRAASPSSTAAGTTSSYARSWHSETARCSQPSSRPTRANQGAPARNRKPSPKS